MARRMVLFPLPLQGHINPMFELGAALDSAGFSLTVLHPEFNFPDPTKCPYELVPIPDGGLSGEAFGDDLSGFIEAVNTVCEAPFRNQMARMLSAARSSGSGGETIACLIVDTLLYKIKTTAEALGVPTLVLRTGSAACFNLYLDFPLLWEKGYMPVKDSEMELPVAEIPPFRVKDLIRMPKICNMVAYYRMIENMVKEARTSSGIIFNTFESIEGVEIDKIRKELGVPVFAIGPLNKLSPGAQTNHLAPDYSCMQWLDKQAPGSVLYVSFGSLSSLDERELIEIAWGLADSHQPFLWVVRPGSIRASSSGQVELPEKFVGEIQGRGMIVKWAPQQEVLSHPAVGGFWTHSGWNSTVEGLSEGVPMLCMPYFADQMANARYASHVWKVSITLENGIQRRQVEKAIERLMVADEGKRMKAMAKDLKEKAARSIQGEGSSSVAFSNLLDRILSFA